MMEPVQTSSTALPIEQLIDLTLGSNIPGALLDLEMESIVPVIPRSIFAAATLKLKAFSSF